MAWARQIAEPSARDVAEDLCSHARQSVGNRWVLPELWRAWPDISMRRRMVVVREKTGDSVKTFRFLMNLGRN